MNKWPAIQVGVATCVLCIFLFTVRNYASSRDPVNLLQFSAAAGAEIVSLEVAKGSLKTGSPYISGHEVFTCDIGESGEPVTVSWTSKGGAGRLSQKIDLPEAHGHQVLLLRVMLGADKAEVHVAPISSVLSVK